MKLHHFFPALMCLISSFAFANDPTLLEETVVTATRIEQPLKETLSSTTVITEDDIRSSQAADILTLLRSVPGVEFSQSGGVGKQASLYMRGSNSTQVLVLLDGVRINSATAGSTAIQDLMLDQIERIEIVRGNVSSVYGSEAIGGVVQIFTRKGKGEPRFNAALGIGNLGTQRFTAGFGAKSSDTQYHLQISSYETAGVSAINPVIKSNASPDNDGYRNQSISTNIKHTLSDKSSLTLRAFNSIGFNQYDNAFGASTDTHVAKQHLSRYTVAMDNKFFNNWNSHMEYALGLDDTHNYTNNLEQASSRFKTSSQQLNWQNTLQIDSGNLQFGAENLTQNINSTTQYTVNERIINSLYAGYTGIYDAHRVQANLRSDSTSQYGIANTGLLGYGYSISEGWRLTGSYGTAFRAPTFNDLYYPGSSNPDLAPELSANREIGVHYSEEQRDIDVVGFDNRIQDLLTYSSTAGKTININQARMDGVELVYTERFGDTTLKASYTTQNPRNESTGASLDRRAKQHGSLSISQKSGSLRWGAEWIASGERMDSNNELPAYAIVNLTASYTLNKDTALSFRAGNITDQNDSNAYSYNPIGRTLFVNLNYTP